MTVLVKANDPENRLTASRITVPSQLPTNLLRVRPLRLALDKKVLGATSTHHSIDDLEDPSFDLVSSRHNATVPARNSRKARCPPFIAWGGEAGI